MNPAPVFTHTYYSWVDDKQAGGAAGIYRYDPVKKAMVEQEAARGEAEARARWKAITPRPANNLWSDTLR